MQLPETIRACLPEIFGRSDQGQHGVGQVPCGKPVQNLEQLELVIQVVLEPEHNLIVGPKIRDRGISQAEIGQHLVILGPPARGNEAGTTAAHFLNRKAGRRRTLVQHISPRDDRAGHPKTELSGQLHRRL